MPNVDIYMSRIKSLLLVIEKEIQKDDSFVQTSLTLCSRFKEISF